MKALIKTARPITPSEIQEVEELWGDELIIEDCDEIPVPTWNNYTRVIEIDWKWFKSLFGRRKADIRAYVTSKEKLRRLSIKAYLGLYNNLDNDGVLDFWFGIPSKLDKRAEKNGFKTNFAWLYTHEKLHGLLLREGRRDVTHEMEKQGRLKELVDEQPSKETRAQYFSLLEQLLALLKILRGYHLPFPQYDNVTQEWLEANPIYTQTGVHVGTDFATPLNTPIEAPDNGTITRVGYSPSLGNWVEYKFSKWYLIALHLREKPTKGARQRGEPIGFVGDTGYIEGIHAHLEIWNRPMDRSLLQSKADVEKYTRDILTVI